MEKHVEKEKEDRVTYRLISEADDEWLQVGRSPVSEVAVWTQSPRVLCSRRRDGFHPKGRTTTYHQFRNADRGHKTLLIWVVPLKFVPHGNTSADFFSLSLPLCNSNLSIFPPILCPLPRYTSLHIQKKFIPILIVVISNSFNYKFNLFIIYKPNTLLKKKKMHKIRSSNLYFVTLCICCDFRVGNYVCCGADPTNWRPTPGHIPP